MNTSEHTMTTWDGEELFYRAWLPDTPTDKALLLFHRGHEHSGRWPETVDTLGLEDVAIFAWDARGHGQSPGERGSAENLAVVVKDIDRFVRHISVQHSIPTGNMVVLAHSVGAITVAAWVHDYAPPIRGLILATPAFRVKLYIPFAIPLLRLRQKLLGPGYVKSYVKAKMLTHDSEQAASYAADESIFRQIAVNILLDLFDTSTRLMADAGAIRTPTLMIVAGADWVVKVSAQRRFFEGLSSRTKEVEVFPDMYHAVFHEKKRDEVVDRVRQFAVERFQDSTPLLSLADADRHGYTKDEFDGFRWPGGMAFAITRFAMRTAGRLSKGIRLGWEAGFDSGTTLDYVYENRAQGITPLGRWIDRAYLNSIGWRGIRQRRTHLERLLREAIERTHEDGRAVHILDIATGGGRYVLETMLALEQVPMTAHLRDYKRANIDAVNRLTEKLGLENVTAELGDAFDRSSLATVTPRPTIAIVSGLYELFPDNEPLVNSLNGIADALEPGSLLIYTNQPWHPQVEFIARVLTNREGQPWIMRRRTQEEMDELVRSAGFEKITMEIDEWGIFTVSVARRVSA